MSSWGKCDFSQIKNFEKQLIKINTKKEKDKFCKECTNELTLRFLREVKKGTPVGKYPKSSIRTGGTLRRSWITTKVKKIGNIYMQEVINDASYNGKFYASYVAKGHRTVNGGFVEPQEEMYLVPLKNLQNSAQSIIDKKTIEFLKGFLKNV